MMDVRKLPEEWVASGVQLREIAATYPSDHVAHACLMSRVGELERCAKELEEALAAVGGLPSQSKLATAIEAVEVGLQVTRRELSPNKKAALFLAAYKLIDDEGETIRAEQAARRRRRVYGRTGSTQDRRGEFSKWSAVRCISRRTGEANCIAEEPRRNPGGYGGQSGSEA